MKQFVLLMQEQRHSQVPDLLLRVFVRTDEVDCFQVSEVDIPPQYIDVQQLADIFLAVIAIEIPFLEFLPYIRKLLIDAFFL